MTDRGQVRVACPAKINLFLAVQGRRDDGYHLLETLFQAIDLHDEITVRPAPGLTLENDAGLPNDPTNLVLRAADALRRAAGRPELGAHLHLRKRIPVQGGLGGGSSDAAAALLACSRLWGLQSRAGELAGIAATLGADVPFFLVGGTALGRGRGDLVEAYDPLPVTPILLGLPPFGMSTAEVFERYDARLTCPVNSVSFCGLFGRKWRQRHDFSFMRNDLQAGVFEDRPALAGFHGDLLAQGAAGALLSGSGSTVFGVFTEDAHCHEAGAALATRYPDWRIVATRTASDGVRFLDR